jgi:hypothetical protein
MLPGNVLRFVGPNEVNYLPFGGSQKNCFEVLAVVEASDGFHLGVEDDFVCKYVVKVKIVPGRVHDDFEIGIKVHRMNSCGTVCQVEHRTHSGSHKILFLYGIIEAVSWIEGNDFLVVVSHVVNILFLCS